jgi:hypothetical protein
MAQPANRARPTPRTRVSRRRFVQASGAVGLTWGAALPARAATGSLEAYADGSSVKQGAQIRFSVRDPSGSLMADRNVPLSIARIAVADVTLLNTTVAVRNRSVPATAYATGCGWPVSYTLTVPTTWPSGLYYAVFGSGDLACCVPFVVRAARQTTGTKVLVQVPVTTAQAYNAYGGKSLYTYNSSNGVAATKVSFDRPHTDPWNFAFDPWQAPFVRWLAKNGIVADFCTSIDLHQDSTVATGYTLLLLAGHDEYWTRAMRDRLDAFVAGGGNAGIFSGNTCWWQSRLEANATGTANRVLVCYKSSSADPDTRAAYKTDNWINLVPPAPENSSIGLGWNRGASWTNALQRPDTPWVVQRDHWVFNGTGLVAGAAFGGAFSGYEIDALEFNRGSDGRAYPLGNDGTPGSLTVLALADASNWDAQAQALGQGGEKSGYGAISIHSRGAAQGVVFNAGATDWAYGLQPELDGQTQNAIGRITLNVVNKLSTAYKESADVRRYKNVQTSGDGSRYFLCIGHNPPAGATLSGTNFRAYPAALSNTAPVYRYRYPQSNGDGLRYFYSLNANVGNGWIADGVAFHAFATAVAGAVPVYQFHAVQTNGDGWRFYFSTRTAESGWVLDGLAFYTPSA